LKTITGLVCLSALVAGAASTANADPARYRGQYTLGHEVNIFCPAINSQCYWLGGKTPADVRTSLQKISAGNTTEPYEPVCVVIEAEIDKDTTRPGFAIEYDGLITITEVFGQCDETEIVTHGDLQHHRWVLESINGEMLKEEQLDGGFPDLDFGEKMHVSGFSGCNRFSGQATLRDDYLVVEKMISTMMACDPTKTEIESIFQKALNNGSKISLNEESDLLLESIETRLQFRLQDWLN